MSDNGTYQQQRRGQLTEAADGLLPEAVNAPGGELATDGEVSLEAFAAEAEHMIAKMTEATKLTREEFITSREFPLPIYRAIIYKRLHEQGCSTVRIGKILGKNHATVIHSIKNLEAYLMMPDKKILDICICFDEFMKQPKTSDMSKLFFTDISYSGGLRKVEADIWPTMTETFRHSLVAEEHLEILKRNIEELIEKRAAELKVKPVPVVLSGSWDKLKDASLPRFLSVGRITVTLTEIRHTIGQTDKKADA